MRISDWSSDVCSSDLIHEPRPICRIVYGGNGMVWVEANWPPSIKDCYARCIHVTLSQERARDRLRLVRRLTLQLSERRSRPLQRLVQIGTASCRERVCPYVELSVVAVFLKKKKM